MLDFVNPISAFGRLVSQAGKLGWDKAKAGHSCYLAGHRRKLRVRLELWAEELHDQGQASAGGRINWLGLLHASQSGTLQKAELKSTYESIPYFPSLPLPLFGAEKPGLIPLSQEGTIDMPSF